MDIRLGSCYHIKTVGDKTLSPGVRQNVALTERKKGAILLTMETKPKKRKRRSDRNHIIYVLRVAGQEYVGVTHVEDGRIAYSLRRRWLKHCERARNELDKGWKLCEAIRQHGPNAFEAEVIEVVRGKVAAHIREKEIVRERNPGLNTDVR